MFSVSDFSLWCLASLNVNNTIEINGTYFFAMTQTITLTLTVNKPLEGIRFMKTESVSFQRGYDGSQHKHASSTESGVDVQGDNLSSSSSSEHG